jgi:hypothetical protein
MHGTLRCLSRSSLNRRPTRCWAVPLRGCVDGGGTIRPIPMFGHFCRRWLRETAQMKAQLRSGNYRFSLLSRVPPKDGEETDLRSARDAPVLKALALVLGDHLPVSRRCRLSVRSADRSTPSQRAQSDRRQGRPVLYPVHGRHSHSGTLPLMASPRGEAGQPEECSIWRSDKPFIGQIERCFDFLANKTIDNLSRRHLGFMNKRREMAVSAVSLLRCTSGDGCGGRRVAGICAADVTRSAERKTGPRRPP